MIEFLYGALEVAFAVFLMALAGYGAGVFLVHYSDWKVRREQSKKEQGPHPDWDSDDWGW